MSVQVKICGITQLEDGLTAARAGAAMLGLNFYPPSPRYLEPDAARTLAAALRAELGADCPMLIGVFVNETPATIRTIVQSVGLDAAQLSGDEPLQDVIDLDGQAFKAIRPTDAEQAAQLAGEFLPHAPADERLPALLVDAYHKQLYGGTGEQASVAVVEAVQTLTPRLMLAGGLTPQNVGGRVLALHPWGVDVASGVEGAQKGIKDTARVRTFIRAAQITPMQAGDWPQVAAIYQEGIATGNATLETDVPAWETWDKAHLADCRLIARDSAHNGGRILGWAALSPVSSRCVYGGVAEVSVYVAKNAQGQGVGKALLHTLVMTSEGAGMWTLQAGILRENAASIALHRACGFREVGYREKLGQLHGVWRDVVLMERRSTIVGV